MAADDSSQLGNAADQTAALAAALAVAAAARAPASAPVSLIVPLQLLTREFHCSSEGLCKTTEVSVAYLLIWDWRSK